MATQRPRVWCLCFSVTLAVVGIVAILKVPLSLHSFGTDRLRVRPECSNPNLLGSNPKIFTHYAHYQEAARHGNTTLLAQARKILDEHAGNQFVQLRESGASPKRYGVSMLHQLHCLELLRSSAASGCSMSRRGRDAAEIDHIGHCFQYLAQVSKFLSIIPGLIFDITKAATYQDDASLLIRESCARQTTPLSRLLFLRQ